MLNSIKSAIFVGCLLSIASLDAYNYKFKNWIESNIEFQFQLVAGIDEPIETITIPAAKKDSSGNLMPGEASRGFDWGRVGLCTNTSTFNVRTLPNGEFKRPFPYGPNRYNFFKGVFGAKDVKAQISFNGSYMPLEKAAKSDQPHMTTCDSTIEIGTTGDGYPIVWVSSRI